MVNLFVNADIVNDEVKECAALAEIDKLLQLNGKYLHEISGMPEVNTSHTIDYTNRLILQELSYDRCALKIEAASIVASLTAEQRVIYETIINAATTSLDGFFLCMGLEEQERHICGML